MLPADGVDHEGWLLLATGVTGLTAAILVAVFADKGHSPAAQLARCAMGFVVAVVWIMAIADEVVEVLQVRTAPSFSRASPPISFLCISIPRSFMPPSYSHILRHLPCFPLTSAA